MQVKRGVMFMIDEETYNRFKVKVMLSGATINSVLEEAIVEAVTNYLGNEKPSQSRPIEKPLSQNRPTKETAPLPENKEVEDLGDEKVEDQEEVKTPERKYTDGEKRLMSRGVEV